MSERMDDTLVLQLSGTNVGMYELGIKRGFL